MQAQGPVAGVDPPMGVGTGAPRNNLAVHLAWFAALDVRPCA